MYNIKFVIVFFQISLIQCNCIVFTSFLIYPKILFARNILINSHTSFCYNFHNLLLIFVIFYIISSCRLWFYFLALICFFCIVFRFGGFTFFSSCFLWLIGNNWGSDWSGNGISISGFSLFLWGWIWFCDNWLHLWFWLWCWIFAFFINWFGFRLLWWFGDWCFGFQLISLCSFDICFLFRWHFNKSILNIESNNFNIFKNLTNYSMTAPTIIILHHKIS